MQGAVCLFHVVDFPGMSYTTGVTVHEFQAPAILPRTEFLFPVEGGMSMHESTGEDTRMRNIARGRISIRTGFAIRFVPVLITAVVLLFVSHAQAIILHDPADAPSESERPADNVLGRWRTNTTTSSNASAVAIGREGWATTGWIITTRHQGSYSGDYTRVTFGGVEYIVKQQFTIGTADLRVCRLENTPENGGGKANLTDFALVNENTSESGNIVIGGYGKTKGTEGSDPAGSYYNWVGTTTLNNLHWGGNSILDTGSYTLGSYVSDVLIDDFDGKTSGDAAIAEWDSGGGWFYQSGDDWVVAGLSAYAIGGRSYFSTTGSYDDWDYNRAVRVSSYATSIFNVIGEHYEPSIPGDANLDGVVDVNDLSILASNYNTPTGATWAMGDFNFDDAVDVNDLSILSSNYGSGGTSSGAPIYLVPEPASFSLLILGVMPLLKRRSR